VIYLITVKRRRWRRHRSRDIGRPPKKIRISDLPYTDRLEPIPATDDPPITIDLAESEAFRLVDLEDLSLEEAGALMGVSRTTVWRLVKKTRKKLARCLYEGTHLEIRKEQ
jgi:predicted DNA-binding protein (UPF0251 family)